MTEGVRGRNNRHSRLCCIGPIRPDFAVYGTAPRGGLGLFVHSLVGLDRHAATEAFSRFLDSGVFTVDQIRFVNLIVDELTPNDVTEPGRLFEPPDTDRAPTGPDVIFPTAEVDVIVGILYEVKEHALPEGAA